MVDGGSVDFCADLISDRLSTGNLIEANTKHHAAPSPSRGTSFSFSVKEVRRIFFQIVHSSSTLPTFSTFSNRSTTLTTSNSSNHHAKCCFFATPRRHTAAAMYSVCVYRYGYGMYRSFSREHGHLISFNTLPGVEASVLQAGSYEARSIDSLFNSLYRFLGSIHWWRTVSFREKTREIVVIARSRDRLLLRAVASFCC